jgi:hypothetical protein
MLSPHDIARIALIGIGATAVMDAWLLLLKRVGVQSANFSFIGRWVGHLARGRWTHASIAKAPPIAAERGLGWLTHYAVGVAFAGLLVSVGGPWLQQPTYWPALAFGIGTVVLPLFVMQPAMGLGFAGAKTPAPMTNCLRSLANHAVFGSGLYVAASVVEWLSR